MALSTVAHEKRETGMVNDGLSTAARESGSDDSERQDELPERVELLYRKLNRALVRSVARQLHDLEAAKEVAQEAYEELLQRYRTGASIQLHSASLGHLRSYLFKTARNIALDRWRALARRERDAHLLTTHIDLEDAPSAERLCIQQQEWERLQKAVAELPPKCRQAFQLIEMEGMSIAEAANRMEMKRNNVTKLCSRAYEHLMTVLATSDSDRGD